MNRWVSLGTIAAYVSLGCAGSSRSERDGSGAGAASGSGGTAAASGSGGSGASGGRGAGGNAATSGAANVAGSGAESPDAACERTGGSVKEAMCCASVGDFPNRCSVGACSCSPDDSKVTRVCECSSGCWDGEQCTDGPEARCMRGHGTVVTLSCCAGVEDFPNTCNPGVCDCAPADSHPVKGCDCGIDSCFAEDGCVIF